jgi:ankyrin repeat protein
MQEEIAAGRDEELCARALTVEEATRGLEYAMEQKQEQCMVVLLRKRARAFHGFNRALQMGPDIMAMFLRAVRSSYVDESIRTFLSIKDAKGNTILHVCASNPTFGPVCELLVSMGADAYVRNAEFATPLHMAAAADAVDCVESLASTWCVSSKVADAFIIAACNSRDGESVRILLKHKVDMKINLAMWDGFLPVHFACRFNRADALRHILKDQPYPNVRSDDGRTPLFIACSFDAVDCVRVLLELGADPDDECMEGLYPVHMAAISESDVLIHLLRKSGAPFARVDDLNRTPVHLAHEKYPDRAHIMAQWIREDVGPERAHELLKKKK